LTTKNERIYLKRNYRYMLGDDSKKDNSDPEKEE
jgi:hypothetical protein